MGRFSKLFFQVILLILLSSTQILSHECHCREGFTNSTIDGKVLCVGQIIPIVLPCNSQQKPSCTCKPSAIAKVVDKMGTWCMYLSDGRPSKENCIQRPKPKSLDKESDGGLFRSFFNGLGTNGLYDKNRCY